MNIFIGTDHAGFSLKEHLKNYLRSKKIPVIDVGAIKLEHNDDYPDYAFLLAKRVVKEKGSKGILLCGSGQGVCIAANKVKGTRAALAWNEKSAMLSRQDDDANILCMPARLISKKQVERIVDVWLKTPFSRLARHKRRIQKIESGEK
ncbi:MAG: ribose 5-phosphate isomerase B [bacterium]|nr:ribose 5-phosphate isomerase B [bacterium]